jgi:hypothetical protein
MNPGRRRSGLLAFALGFTLAQPAGAQEHPFDASEFEKKPFELGGYVELKHEQFSLNPGSAFYELGDFSQRQDLGRETATLQLVGRARKGIGTFDFRTSSVIQHDQLADFHETKIFEAAYSVRPSPGLTGEVGKRALRWGKGYAWNPIGFVERLKDPNDPQLAREGFGMADADWISSPGGDLQTIAFTAVLLPVNEDINSDFGASGYLNPAAKLYMLYKDTDIDFAWQGKGSRPARFGFDFSRNLRSNLEVHGEWARILDFTRPLADIAGNVSSETRDATSYLLGLRYLTERDTTYIAEYYRNGTGYSDQEANQFYQLVDSAISSGNASLLQKAQSLAHGSYGRPNIGEEYLYIRAQQKDALGIVYFQPAIFGIMNLQDRSFQLTPELLYTGINNLELRFRVFLLNGGSGTEFGEKQVKHKLELYARYYF